MADTSKDLGFVWGAKKIAPTLGLPSNEKGQRRVRYLAKKKQVAGLDYVGRRLRLATKVTNREINGE